MTAVDVDVTGELAHLGTTGWMLWRDAGLRTAGFPAERVRFLCDEALADAADRVDGPDVDDSYAEEFAAATGRLSAAVRRIASDNAFREAVTWQNPALLETCLDKAAAGEPRNVRGRNHELTIASYLQRYCLKNDTIGFFGPVGWARLDPAADAGVIASPGPHLVGRRTTYFEHWAIESVSDAIADLPGVFPWLRPRREPSVSITGTTVLVPFHGQMTLPPREFRLLARCDGRRTIRDLAGDPPDPATIAALLRLRDRGVLRIDLRGPLSTWPEHDLAARIAEIPDETVRARAQWPLDALVRARDRVAAAAGDAERLALASAGLAEVFREVAKTAPTRRPGEVYAARTLVYEDAVRDIDVRIGRRLTDELAAPLSLVLDSACWLADRVAQRVEAEVADVLSAAGAPAIPLLRMLGSILPELGNASIEPRAGLVDDVVDDFQQRWARVLDLPPGGDGRHRFSAAAIAERVALEFPAGTPRWSAARWFCPDIMLAADGPDSLETGAMDAVLGEIHCATNTLRYRMFAEQHPDRRRLREAIETVDARSRVVLVPTTNIPRTTARMAEEPLLADSTYVCLGAEALAVPPGATTISVVDLDVTLVDGVPVVRHRKTGNTYDFIEVIGEPLSLLVAGAFRPFARRDRRPRVSIDQLVIGRAAWSFPAADIGWAFERDEGRRFALARRWRREHGMPERGFARVPVELKPVAVDFSSLPLVNLFAKAVRRTAGAGPGEVHVTEMLPDLGQLWLRDADDRRYTAELRLVAVRPAPATAGE